MKKKIELNSYALTDDFHGDYMVYEIKYENGYKEYVSREVFNYLKALEIIKDIGITIEGRDIGNNRVCVILNGVSKIPTPEFDLLKEVLL